MNLKRIATFVTAAAAMLVLSGCAGPTVMRFNTAEEVAKVHGVGTPVYGYVVNLRDFDQKKFCQPDTMEIHRQQCPNPANWRLAAVNTHTKYGFIYKANVLVPVAAGVQVDDVIEFTASGADGINKFIRIASRKDSPNRKTCDWDGSKLLNTGGVVCDGYHYKSLPHFTR